MTMGIGLGIILLVLGLILLLGVVDLPASVHDVVATNTLGWILLLAGVLALVLGLVVNAQRSKTTHVEERREV
jgi:membrane-bound ClpP family serine protease